jgi:hypothetical protein
MELSSIATIPRSRLFTKFESLDGSVIFANKSKIEKEDGALGENGCEFALPNKGSS